MNFRAYQDNVLLALEPDPAKTASGLLHLVPTKHKEHRTAIVLRVGPGHKRPCCGVFVPTTVKPGQRVIVDKLAGQDYQLDLNAVRQNAGQEFGELLGIRGEFRVVREDEILAVFEDEAQAAE